MENLTHTLREAIEFLKSRFAFEEQSTSIKNENEAFL